MVGFVEQDSASKTLGRFDVDWVVERYEGLERGVGPIPFQDTDLTARCVEGGHGRVRIAAAPLRVDRAAKTVLACAGIPVGPGAKSSRQSHARLGRTGRGSVEFFRQQVGRSQRHIPDLLGCDSEPGTSCDVSILRIGLEVLGGDARGLPISVRKDDAANQLFVIPTAT